MPQCPLSFDNKLCLLGQAGLVRDALTRRLRPAGPWRSAPVTLLPPDIDPHSDSVQSVNPFLHLTLITLYHLSPSFLSCIWVSVSELLALPFCLLFLSLTH